MLGSSIFSIGKQEAKPPAFVEQSLRQSRNEI